MSYHTSAVCFEQDPRKVPDAIMWRILIAIVALTGTPQAHGKVFDNPVLDGADYPDPGAILVDGVYYVVTTTNNNLPEKFPISMSRDLNSWASAGYAFNASNLPVWSDKDQAYWAPEIHRVGSNFLLYFTSNHIQTNQLAIGVATAPSPLGPYTPMEEPLLLDPTRGSFDATLLHANETLYLLWKGGDFINGRPLNPDGLSFSSDETTELFRNEIPWEDSIVEAPWHTFHGQYHYIFYSGHGYCSELYRVGVARSLNPLGPYQKYGEPILKSNTRFEGPGHNSMVKDMDGVGDVMVFHAFRKDEVCGPWPRLTLLASVGWRDDEWPYVFDFK